MLKELYSQIIVSDRQTDKHIIIMTGKKEGKQQQNDSITSNILY